jgi:hypothetical protein
MSGTNCRVARGCNIEMSVEVFYQIPSDVWDAVKGGIHTIHEIHAIQHITAFPNRLMVPPHTNPFYPSQSRHYGITKCIALDAIVELRAACVLAVNDGEVEGK